MKKIIAALVLCVLALVGFFAYQGHEKSIQNDLYEEAAVFFEEEDYKKAIQYFDEAREHDNLFTGNLEEEILYYKAEGYLNLGETEEAIAIYDQFILENPKEPMNYILEGYCYLEAGNYDEAYTCYWNGYDQTGEEDFLVQLCNIDIQMEEYDKALEVAADVSGLQDDEIVKELKFLEIVIFEKQQKYEQAYEKAAAYCEAYPDDEKGKKEKDFLESRK